MTNQYMPTAELGFWGRYWRRVSSHLPTRNRTHCRECGDHLGGRLVDNAFCSVACADHNETTTAW